MAVGCPYGVLEKQFEAHKRTLLVGLDGFWARLKTCTVLPDFSFSGTNWEEPAARRAMGKKGKEAARERREQRRREVTHLRAVPYEPHQRWWHHLGGDTSMAVAVVTGANRGIGFEAARQLALHGLHVVLASRDAERGQDAAERIPTEAPGGSVEWRQLDVVDAASVEAFAVWVAETHGGIHVLVSKFSSPCLLTA
jgi:hypothetical protein